MSGRSNSNGNFGSMGGGNPFAGGPGGRGSMGSMPPPLYGGGNSNGLGHPTGGGHPIPMGGGQDMQDPFNGPVGSGFGNFGQMSNGPFMGGPYPDAPFPGPSMGGGSIIDNLNNFGASNMGGQTGNFGNSMQPGPLFGGGMSNGPFMGGGHPRGPEPLTTINGPGAGNLGSRPGMGGRYNPRARMGGGGGRYNPRSRMGEN